LFDIPVGLEEDVGEEDIENIWDQIGEIPLSEDGLRSTSDADEEEGGETAFETLVAFILSS